MKLIKKKKLSSRPSLSQERFSSLAILSVESEVTNTIDFNDDAIKDLVSIKASEKGYLILLSDYYLIFIKKIKKKNIQYVTYIIPRCKI